MHFLCAGIQGGSEHHEAPEAPKCGLVHGRMHAAPKPQHCHAIRAPGVPLQVAAQVSPTALHTNDG